ncbi:MAG: MFS transporter [Defluviitaleaceae bacterium]|nr:MFS transporter [Defluviitaleaceae bacterium]
MFTQMRRALPTAPVSKLFVFVGLVWAAMVGSASIVLILTYLGASSAQIGMFIAISSVLSMVFQPVWGMRSDKTGSPRKVLCMCLVGMTVFFGAVMLTGNFYIAAALLFLEVIFRCGVIGLLDSHTLSEVNAMPGLQYGHIRLAGSVFFGSLSLLYSVVINNFGVLAIIPISVGVSVVAIGFGLLVAKGVSEKGATAGEGVHMAKPHLKTDALSLIKNKRYISLILFIALSALALQPLWVFLVEYVRQVGGNPGHVPLIHALRCVVEIPLFIFVGTACKRVSSLKLMVVGICFMFVYVLVLLFATSLVWVIVAHLVGGTPGFIFGLTGRLRRLNEVTPDSVRSTSITLMGTVELGLGAIIGNFVAGFVLEAHGTRALSLLSLGALVVAAGMLVYMVATKGAAQRG